MDIENIEKLWKDWQALDEYESDAILPRMFGWFNSILRSKHSSKEEKKAAEEFFKVMEAMMKPKEATKCKDSKE